MIREASRIGPATRWSMMQQSVDRFEAPAVVCSTELGRAYANAAAAGEGCLACVIHAMGLTQSGRNGTREATVRPADQTQAEFVAGRRASGLPSEFVVESPGGRGRFLVTDLRDARGRSVGWLATLTRVQAARAGASQAFAASLS
ncbi:MAG TPA: hypothetical protein VMZ31_09020 [Phycisphaerae bacterium]|nr:hypothetical protein [Phycisphaerae bacterium]